MGHFGRMGPDGAVGTAKTGGRRSDEDLVGSIDVVGVAFEQDPA